MSYKKKLTVIAGVSFFALVGCSQSNPLNQYSHRKVADDLFQAAIVAELDLGLSQNANDAGPYYYRCMEGQQKKGCTQMYKQMVKNLRVKYHGLTVRDIQDKKLWSFVKPYYRSDLFNRLPA